MTYRRIAVRKLGGAGGARITGVDLSRPVDDDTLAEIRRALAEYLVVTIPDQPLDDPGLAAFTTRLGEFGTEPYVEGLETHPNVIAVVKEADETRRANFGGNWHSDWSFQQTPPSYTLLHARELPPVGGDTLFANQYLAFDTLSPGMKRLLTGLRAVHSARRSYGPQSIFAGGTHLRSMKIKTGPEALAEFVHPAVRVHPDTGRAALFVNKVYTIRFEDMTEAESAGLLTFLFEHSVRHEFIVRVAWQPQALTIWDNRVVQHFAVNDYDGYRREMHRTTVRGEQPIPAPNQADRTRAAA
jgi:taurine dioxygenase